MLAKMVINMLLRGLGPINGWKTVAGIVLAVVNLAAQYMDVVPAVIPAHLGEVLSSVMIGLGLGDKMGKERANGSNATAKAPKGKK